jgi:hypothetical protein
MHLTGFWLILVIRIDHPAEQIAAVWSVTRSPPLRADQPIVALTTPDQEQFIAVENQLATPTMCPISRACFR